MQFVKLRLCLANVVESLNDKEFEEVDKIKSLHELTTKWESDKGTLHMLQHSFFKKRKFFMLN